MSINNQRLCQLLAKNIDKLFVLAAPQTTYATANSNAVIAFDLAESDFTVSFVSGSQYKLTLDPQSVVVAAEDHGVEVTDYVFASSADSLIISNQSASGVFLNQGKNFTVNSFDLALIGTAA